MNKRRLKRRSGAAAVEFAFTAPVLFFILFGSLELGRANMLFNTAEAAAYEGARTGIVPGASAAECIAAANDILRIGRVSGATVTVQPSQLSESVETVEVRVRIPVARNSMIGMDFISSLVVDRSCLLRREVEGR